MYLALGFFVALFGAKVANKLTLPHVTGFLVAGLLFGPYGLKIIPHNVVDLSKVISEIALGFIALSIGAEFKLSYLKRVGKAPVVIAVLEGLMAVVLVDFALIIMGHDLAFSLSLGAIAAATAPAATLMIVRQYKANGPVTQTLLPVVALDDAVALIAFGLSTAIAKSLTVGNVSLISAIGQPLLEIAGALALGAGLGVAYSLVVKVFGKSSGLSISIAMVLLSIGLCRSLNFSGLLCIMMMSSVFVNLSDDSDSIFANIDILTPPLFMLFFFFSGAELDVTILTSVGVIGIIYLLVRVLGKVSGAALGCKLSKSPDVVSKYLGWTLVPQAGVAIGLASSATLVVPQYAAQIKTVVLCSTVIYELVGPLCTKIALKKAGEIKSA